jgi:hypothetical protein
MTTTKAKVNWKNYFSGTVKKIADVCDGHGLIDPEAFKEAGLLDEDVTALTEIDRSAPYAWNAQDSYDRYVLLERDVVELIKNLITRNLRFDCVNEEDLDEVLPHLGRLVDRFDKSNEGHTYSDVKGTIFDDYLRPIPECVSIYGLNALMDMAESFDLQELLAEAGAFRGRGFKANHLRAGILKYLEELDG